MSIASVFIVVDVCLLKPRENEASVGCDSEMDMMTVSRTLSRVLLPGASRTVGAGHVRFASSNGYEVMIERASPHNHDSG